MEKLQRRPWFWPILAGLGTLLLFLWAIWVPPGKVVGNVQIGAMRISFSSLVSAAGFLIALALAIPNLVSLAQDTRSTNYSQLDTMYADILKMAVEKPWLRYPGGLSNEQRPVYESYAYIVWNFLETVRDRCAGDLELQSIWGPVIAAEAHIHYAWFEAETKAYDHRQLPKFRPQFVDFVWSCFGGDPATICGNVFSDGGAWIRQSWIPRDGGAIKNKPYSSRWRGSP